MDIEHEHSPKHKMVNVYASVDGKTVGHAVYNTEHGEVRHVEVHPDHRRKGVATAMYKHLQKHGWKTKPSGTLTPQGRKMWDSGKLNESGHHSRMFRYHDSVLRVLDKAIKKGGNKELRKERDYHQNRLQHHQDRIQDPANRDDEGC